MRTVGELPRGACPATRLGSATSVGVGRRWDNSWRGGAVTCLATLFDRRRPCTRGWASNSIACRRAAGRSSTSWGLGVEPSRPSARWPIRRLARGGRKDRAVHLDHLRHPAPGTRPSRKPQVRVVGKPESGGRLSRRGRKGYRLAGRVDRLAQRRGGRGFRHRTTDSRPALSGQSPHADRLRRPPERRPYPVGRQTRTFADLVPRHVAQGRHETNQYREPGHRVAPRRPGHGTLSHARLVLSRLSGRHALAREYVALGRVERAVHRRRRSALQTEGPSVSTRGIARRWTPARSCSGRRKKTFTH